MRGKCSFTALLWFFLPLSVAIQSTEPGKNDLPPPTNITFTIPDMFHVLFKWDHVAANCSPNYRVSVSAPGYTDGIQTTTSKLSWKPNIYKIPDLNKNFSVEIVVYCNDMRSPVVERNMPLVPGNEAVKSLSCLWQYAEYINCTWQLRADAPRNVQYKLLYWEEDSSSGTLPESTLFEDLLRSGNECEEYYTSGGMHSGCTFSYKYSLTDHKELMLVVTDASHSVKPYFYYTAAKQIAKLRCPNITHVSEPINKVIHVNWTVSPKRWECKFEVLVTSDTWSLPPLTVTGDTNATITIPHADDAFRVKVRARFSASVAFNLPWSEWSPEWIVPGKNKTSILLFLLIPAIVLVAAVILLVFLKRLKILICPPIPHPGKMFQNDLQHWLMGDRPATVYDQPEIEEITAVTALQA